MTDKEIDVMSQKDIIALFQRVNKDKPKQKDIVLFRRVLDHRTNAWRIAGDVANITKHNIIEKAAGGRTVVERSLEQGYEHVKDELGYPEATMLEKLLIEQIALTWLRHSWIEYRYQAMDNNRDASISQMKYWDRKLSMSQRRLLRACESLAKVRRMATRTAALQLNIADKQVNQVNAGR